MNEDEQREWWAIPMEQRVKYGVELLDQSQPNWRSRIKLVELDMQSLDFCILGQLYGTYCTGTATLGIDGCYYGFDGVWAEAEEPPNALEGEMADRYAELTQLWLAELQGS